MTLDVGAKVGEGVGTSVAGHLIKKLRETGTVYDGRPSYLTTPLLLLQLRTRILSNQLVNTMH